MTKLVLKAIATGETITVTDAEFTQIVQMGNLKYYEVQERIEEVEKQPLPTAVKKELDKKA